MKCFNGFCKEGVVHADTVGEILQMMGLRVKKEALQAIIDEVDEDGKANTTLLFKYRFIQKPKYMTDLFQKCAVRKKYMNELIYVLLFLFYSVL